MIELYGKQSTAKALKAARIAAGFRSATAAAAAFGWSGNTLRGHESGTRKISEQDAKKYAVAFGVNVNHILGSGDTRKDSDIDRSLERLIATETSKEEKKRKEIAERLVFARIVRGFDKLSSAAAYLGAPPGTVSNHERGENKISERLAEAYALAYAISPAWLLRGELPSGLGPEVDKALASRGVTLARLALRFSSGDDSWRIVDVTKVRSQFANATARQTVKDETSERIHEIDMRDADALRFGVDRESPRATWQLPAGLAPSLLGSRSEDLFIIAVPRGDRDWELGDRLFVDRSKRDVGRGGMFAYLYVGAGLRFKRHQPGDRPLGDGDLLGKVVASFISLGNEPVEMSEARAKLWDSLR